MITQMLIGFPLKQFQLCKDGDGVNHTNDSAPAMKISYIDVVKTLPDGKTIKVKQKIETPDLTTNNLTDDCLWVDENALTQYTNKGYSFTGKKRMSYCPPEWISDKTGGGILLLDDYSRANPRFLQACMELIDTQSYISWKLPADWTIILSSNPNNGNYLVNESDIAMTTRYISVEMKWQVDRWAEWAEREGIDGRAINFVLLNPEVVTPKVNPRAITKFFNCISSFKNFDDNLSMIQMIGEGSVGPEVATLFTMFINNKLDQLPTPKEIFTGADDVTATDKLRAAINQHGNYRADIASILTTRIINYAIEYAHVNPIEDKHIKRIIHLVKTPSVLTDDLKYHLVKKILNGNKTKFQKVIYDPIVQDFATK